MLNPVTTITGNTVEISGTYTRLPLPPKPAPGPAGLYLELPLLPAGHYTFVVDLAPDPSYPNPPPVNTATGRVAAGVTLAAALDVTYVAAITPQAGLWWNPDESGTGYSFDVKHGVLVVTVYSYTPEGSPIWYLAFGPIVHNFAALTNFRYANGQCISCPYKPPVDNGIGGDMQIEFTSPTSANVYLTGRRTTFTIVPQDF